jgi:16S rRNA (cytosine967-C5)-methyltransferase
MKTVVAQQRAILTGAAERIKVGGRIVYSTCSMEPEEDEALVAAWLRHRPRFALAQQRKLIPTQDGVDGAYAALITCRDSKS